MRNPAAPLEALFGRLFDDAAVFPPGNALLSDAVDEHLELRTRSTARLLGPLVVSLGHLDDLATVVERLEPSSLPLAVTVPSPDLAVEAVRQAGEIPSVQLEALESALPAESGTASAVSCLRSAIGVDSRTRLFLEVPAGVCAKEALAPLSDARTNAKLRTGGLTADSHPTEDDLANSIVGLGELGIPFKATAGLHHAVRNTDDLNGFEQHGYLNLIVAVASGLQEADTNFIAGILAERDPWRLVEALRSPTFPTDQVRSRFLSFGTCSIEEPVREAIELGLLADSQWAYR